MNKLYSWCIFFLFLR